MYIYTYIYVYTCLQTTSLNLFFRCPAQKFITSPIGTISSDTCEGDWKRSAHDSFFQKAN